MQHSPSSIALAERCDRAWWYRYRDRLRPPELSWPDAKAMRARGEQLPAGAYSKALGTEMHRLAEIYLTLPPRKASAKIDWNDLPGQCLAELVPHLPPAGSVPRRDVEARMSVVVRGVRFRGLIDVVGSALQRVVEVWDHKTSRDIRTYALLPHAVALRTKQPKRSLRDDLQACLYVLARAMRTRPVAPGGLCRWNYSETQRTRRALPVVQFIPFAHARTVAERASYVAERVESFRKIDDATPNTLACDEYGGCWYRNEGHCSVRRKWGAVFVKLEREEKEKKAMGKPLTFKSLGAATAKANEAEESKAKAADAKPAKRKSAPPPEPEESEEETDAEDEDDEAPESEPAPKRIAKKAKASKRAPVVEDTDEVPESEHNHITAREQFNAATAAPDGVLQFFKTKGLDGEAKIVATAFAELADHLGSNLPRNPCRAECLKGLLRVRDDAVRALEYKDA